MKKSTFKLTEKHQEALTLINNSFANIWSHPKGARGGKDAYQDCNDDEDICEYCGKKAKEGDGNYFNILADGLIIPNAIDWNIIEELYEMDLVVFPQGAFKIGSTCAKKLLGKELPNYI